MGDRGRSGLTRNKRDTANLVLRRDYPDGARKSALHWELSQDISAAADEVDRHCKLDSTTTTTRGRVEGWVMEVKRETRVSVVRRGWSDSDTGLASTRRRADNSLQGLGRRSLS